MSIWRSLVRAVLSDYGLIGRAIADKVDRDGMSTGEYTAFEPEAPPPQPAVTSMPMAFEQKSTHEPIREVTYQVLTNNNFWRAVGTGINAGSAVIDALSRLKCEYPDVPVRAIDKITQALIDIRM